MKIKFELDLTAKEMQDFCNDPENNSNIIFCVENFGIIKDAIKNAFRKEVLK